MILAVDFDGVCRNLDGTDVPGAARWLKKKSRNHKIIIHTCRARYDGGYELVEAWMSSHDLNFSITAYKPEADLYIDDKAYRFEGRFPSQREMRTCVRPQEAS